MTTEPVQRAHVTMYTDGACLGNPGRGGYGVILESGAHLRELSAGYRLTTNNRMEIQAVIAGLEALRIAPSTVTVYSDSQYLVNAMRQGWAKRWREKGWRRSDGHPALNADLWARLLDLCERHEVTFEWVRGHAGHPQNERCDQLSVQAAKGTDLLEDVGYTSPAAVQPAAAQVPLMQVAEVPITPDNRAVDLRCNPQFMWIALRDDRELRVPLAWYPTLAQASAGERHDYRLEDDGRVISFPALDLRIRLDDVLGLPTSAAPLSDEE